QAQPAATVASQARRVVEVVTIGSRCDPPTIEGSLPTRQLPRTRPTHGRLLAISLIIPRSASGIEVSQVRRAAVRFRTRPSPQPSPGGRGGRFLAPSPAGRGLG